MILRVLLFSPAALFLLTGILTLFSPEFEDKRFFGAACLIIAAVFMILALTVAGRSRIPVKTIPPEYEALRDLEDLFAEVGKPLKFSDLPVNIDYEDADGITTNRDIIIRQVEGEKFESGGMYIDAHCLLRNETRHFKVDRVVNAHIGDLVIDLPEYLVKMYMTSRRYRLFLNNKTDVEK